MRDLYDTLGVAPEASEDDIKRAYRRLSMTYHPDRRLDADEKKIANDHWLDISAAYDVLADGTKRLVYDELGPENMEQALALIKHTKPISAEQLRERWKRAQARSEERELASRMKLNGSVVFSLDGTEILQPGDPSIPPYRRSLLHLSSVAMKEEMALAFDSRNTASLTHHVVTKAGLGASTLRIGFARQLSAVSSLHLTSAMDGSLGITASRRISSHSSASAQTNLTLGGPSSITFSGSRQLTKRCTGEMLLDVAGPGSVGSLTVRISRTGATRPSASRRRGKAGESADEDGKEELEKVPLTVSSMELASARATEAVTLLLASHSIYGFANSFVRGDFVLIPLAAYLYGPSPASVVSSSFSST